MCTFQRTLGPVFQSQPANNYTMGLSQEGEGRTSNARTTNHHSINHMDENLRFYRVCPVYDNDVMYPCVHACRAERTSSVASKRTARRTLGNAHDLCDCFSQPRNPNSTGLMKTQDHATLRTARSYLWMEYGMFRNCSNTFIHSEHPLHHAHVPSHKNNIISYVSLTANNNKACNQYNSLSTPHKYPSCPHRPIFPLRRRPRMPNRFKR